ncbi:MAG TPA: TlpA disulfide reductase family protein [Bacteroidia bacterium]|nr:TlpA disulfide reductase family protein [Bacteroidia bacterium]
MKKGFVIILAALAIAGCKNKTATTNHGTFELDGKLTNSQGQKIYLEQLTPTGAKTLDTTVVDKSGEFHFYTNGIEIGFYNVKIDDRNFATMILDSSEKVTVTGNAQDLGNTVSIEGSPDTKIFMDMNQFLKTNYAKRDSLTKLYQVFANLHKDKKSLDSLSNGLEKPFDSILGQQNKYLTNFIDAHSTSLASLAAIQQLNSDEFFPYYQKLDKALTTKYPDSPYIKYFHSQIDDMMRLSIGSEAPDIKLNDPLGDPVSLSSFRGKVVLIDFWASWCGPCKEELPNVVAAYKKYKDKGFTVFSVSLDKDKKDWTDAIQKFNLTWTQVSDLGYWNSSVVKLYHLTSIPQTYLIDKDGKIIAKGLRGDDLQKKLAEILK